MTTLIENKLYCVEVPSDATEIQTWNHGIGFKTNMLDRKPDDTNGFYHIETGLFKMKDFKILGEVDADTIYFDVEPYLEYDKYLNKPINYIQIDMVFKDKNESFRSLLQSKLIYFENPMGKLEICCSGRDCGCMGMPTNISSMEELEEWEEFENKVIKGKLIILDKL